MIRRRAAALAAVITMSVGAAMLPSVAEADTSWGADRSDTSWGMQHSGSDGGFAQRDTSWG